VKLNSEWRLLNVKGYDIILGLDLDWLAKLGPMKIDWGKRRFSERVCLEVMGEVAEIQMLEKVKLLQELMEGSEVIFALI
jgi:hypothetical protein